MAALCQEHEPKCMKTNQYRDDSEHFRELYSANDPAYRTDQGPKLQRARLNGVFRVGDSPNQAVTAAIANHRPFPLRTLIVCFTIWLIATQAMIFDQIKFDERAHLLEQEARSHGAPQVLVPIERPSNEATGATVQRL
jgi:hypothetical protein